MFTSFLRTKEIKCIANAFQSHKGNIYWFLCFEENADIFHILLQWMKKSFLLHFGKKITILI